MDESPSKVGTGLAWFGLIAMVTLVMFRAMVEHDAFPWWVSDPFVFSPPVIGLTPTKAFLLNLGVVLSSSLMLIGLFLRKECVGTLSAILLLVGVAIIAHHGFHTFESVLEGSNLLAIVAVLYVASCAHKLGHAQRLIGAITLGFALLLVVMGSYEMFVIHPETIANYEITRDSFLAARGWTPGSFEALAYERRLFQPEPIAWFGLTNVFASFVGAGSAGLLIFGWRTRKTDPLSIIALLGGLIALAGLVMTGAKGGIGAFGLGLGVTIAAMSITRIKLDGKAILAMCSLVILGVIARGFVGERIGELSLLFRSQYMTGAMRMFFGDPIFGVGPGSFQEHYTYLKPALSPEDVASAHSLPFDLLALLGIGGVALVGVLISIIARIRPDTKSKDEASGPDRRQLIQITMLIIAIASVVSIRFGSGAMDVNLLVTQALASLAWAGLAYVIVRRDDLGASLQWAMFAGASVLAIHAMIEVSATWFVSGMLWALMVGGACTTSGKADESKPRLILTGVVLGLIGSIAVFGMRLPSIMAWERELNLAAAPAIEVSIQREALGGQQSPELNRLEFDGRTLAIEHLVRAAQIRPTHMPTRIAASQQILWRASVLESAGEHEEAAKEWDRAIELIEVGAKASPGASGYRWLGSVWFGRAMQFPDDPARMDWLDRAQSAWSEAFVRSPRDPHLALKLMDLAIEQGAQGGAISMAKWVIQLNEQSRLDPLRGVSEEDLARARSLVRRSP